MLISGCVLVVWRQTGWSRLENTIVTRKGVEENFCEQGRSGRAMLSQQLHSKHCFDDKVSSERKQTFSSFKKANLP